MIPGLPEGVLVVIPAFDAASSLPLLLEKLGAVHPRDATLVVDDGSSDATARRAREAGVFLERHTHNHGKGTALVTGFGWAARQGFEVCVTLDADGQHDPADLPGFASLLEDPRMGVAVGARDLRDPAMPFARRLSNRLTTLLLTRRAGTPLWDSQSGYRAYRMLAVQQAKLPDQGRFEWESRALVAIARAGWTVGRVPVRTVYTGQVSHIRLWADTLRFVHMWRHLPRN